MTERQSMGSEVMQTFWNAVGVPGNGLYDKELELEQALWRSTGDMSVPPGVVPDDPLDVPVVAPCGGFYSCLSIFRPHVFVDLT